MSRPIKGEFSSDSRGRVDAAVVDQVAAVAGVARARGAVDGSAQLVRHDGSTTSTDGIGTTTGANWIDDTELNPFRLASGHAPAAPDEVVVDAHTAKAEHWSLGDPDHRARQGRAGHSAPGRDRHLRRARRRAWLVSGGDR